MSEVVVVREPQAVAVTPMAMLQLAVQNGASVEQLERLMALNERHEANEAKKAFVAALNAFKQNPPEVVKNKQVGFGKTTYSHATLEDASAIIGAALSQHGISHRWNVEQTEGKVKVTCILTHSMGHSESVSMEAGLDNSGSKNSIQALGSTVSYLQRYTIFASAGLAPKGAASVDDDGRGGVGAHEMDPRTKDEFVGRVNGLGKPKEADALWQEIAAECTKCGDVAAYDELKKALAARVKELKAAEAKADV